MSKISTNQQSNYIEISIQKLSKFFDITLGRNLSFICHFDNAKNKI